MSSTDHEVPHYAVFSSPLAINPFTVEISSPDTKSIFIAGLGAGKQHRSLCGKDVCSTERTRTTTSTPCILSRLKRERRAFSKLFLDISGSHGGVGETVTEVNMHVSVGKV